VAFSAVEPGPEPVLDCLGGYDAICAVANNLLPRFHKVIRDWLVSGSIEERMPKARKAALDCCDA
jgi:hypothetical protein